MDVLPACEYVIRHAEDVKLDWERFKNFEELIDKYKDSPGWDVLTKKLLEGVEHKIELSVLRDALNFKFWEKEGGRILRNENMYNDKTYYGASGLAACIRRAVDEDVPLHDPEFLQQVNLSEAEEIFNGNIRMPMLEKRVDIMRELGSSGKPLDYFLDNVEHELWPLVERLSEAHPCYRDVWKYGRKEVPIFKRAQLMFNTLHKQGYLKVEKTEESTVFADYRIPQSLRELGLLKYSEALEYKVDSYQLLPAGSAEEVEIRAATIVACERLANEYGLPILRVDNILWRYGREHCELPHHLTETTCY
ncbi:MAG: queuosine salvage family protein [Candidatus Aenigmatarchaeota archaeon]